jgi:hypothetical protein
VYVCVRGKGRRRKGGKRRGSQEEERSIIFQSFNL